MYDLARDRYAKFADVFKSLDDKAGSVITSVGGGTGVFTLGSLAAIASEKIHVAVVLAAVPSVVWATVSLAFAARARVTRVIAFPSPADAVKYVEQLHGIGNPKAAFIGAWHELGSLYLPAIESKASNLNRSIWCFVGAVASLLLPLLTGIVVRLVEGRPPTVGVERFVEQTKP